MGNPESTGATLRLGAAWGKVGIYSAGDITVGSESTVNFWVAGGQKAYVDGSANMFAYGSMRAPTFYDYNNTSYYVTPSGTSNLNGLNLSGVLNSSAAGNFNTVTWGNVMGATNGHPRSMAIGFSGGNYGQIGYGISYTGTSSLHNYAITDVVSLWEAYDGIRVFAAAAGTVGTGITWTTVLDARRSNTSLVFKGNTIPMYGSNISGNLYASVFYDSDNTGYYVDPNNVSYLYEPRMAWRTLIGEQSYDATLFDGGYPTYRPGIVVRGQYPHIDLVSSNIENYNHGPTLRFAAYDTANASSGNFKHWVMGCAGTNAYRFSIGYAANISNPHYGIYGAGTTCMWIENDTTVYTNASIRPTIIYDRNDTGYYVDPNGTSWIAYPTYIGGSIALTEDRWINNKYFSSGGTAYLPFIYDSNDTNYYLDPNSSSHLNYLRLNYGWGGGDFGAEAFTIAGNYPSMCLRNSTSNTKWLIHNDGSGYIQWYHGSPWNDNSWTRYAQISPDQFHHVSSVRSPIFYDYDNTGYYADPAGTTNFNGLTVNGNVGIGTTTPLSKLQISAGDNSDVQLLIGQGTSYGAPSIRFKIASTNYMGLGFTTGSSVGNEVIDAIAIQRTGNVGIGTTAPDVRLHSIGGTTKLNKNSTKTTTSYSYADLVLGDDTSSRTGYGGTGNNLMLHSNDKSSIGFLHQGCCIGQISYYNNTFRIGEDVGWGSANTIMAGSVTVGGVNVGGLLSLREGTTSALSLALTNDSTVGLYIPNTHNYVAFVVGGNRVFYVDGQGTIVGPAGSGYFTLSSSGVVGIKNPYGFGLNISSNIQQAFVTSFEGTLDASSSTAGSVVFSGGVGIAKKLFVGGDLNLITGSTNGTNFNIINTDAGATWSVGVAGTASGTGASAGTFFWYKGGTRMTLDMSGNLSAATSMRSSVFYDQDDTNYWLDPAGNTISSGLSMNLKSSALINGSGNSTGYGLALYPSWSNANGSNTQPYYGVMFAQTSYYGTHGNVSADWATYFTMDVTSNRGWIFRNVNGSGNIASISNAGYATFASLGIGTAASGTSGEIRATNNITAYYSDERLKTKLGPIENPIEKVKALSGFYFEANETAVALGYQKKREVGVSAQEVQAILPEIIAPAPISDEYLTVRYEKLIPLLIEAIKEQQTQIESLRNELAQLKSNK